MTHLFHLSDKEQDTLQAAKVGEGLLIAGNGRVWLQVELASHERQLLERVGAAPHEGKGVTHGAEH